MADSQVQLKREEVVGDEVILTDINPQTTSDSVIDLNNGLTLEDSLNRMWNAINNKLSRVVNSVNGRTGVVVLTAEDVGLENVDNISFANIQEWVINQIKEEFGERAFKLYDHLDEAEITKATNNKSLSGAAFYSAKGREQDNDNLAYIGVFFWDDSTDTLQYISKALNIIGQTDNSLLYNETANGKDYTYGKLGINIWKDENGLEIYNGISDNPDEPKANAGLRLVRENIVPGFETMIGCYGSDFEHPGAAEDSWLYAASHPNDAPTVKIIYDGKDLSENSTFYAKKTFRLKDQFICCFSAKYGFNYETKSENLNLPAGVSPALVDQHNALGIVTEVIKDNQDVVTSYTVEFTPLAPRVGDGICYANYFTRYGYVGDAHDMIETLHNNQLSINTGKGAITTEVVHDDVLDPASTYIPEGYFGFISDNVSGVTIRRNRDQRNTSGESYSPGVNTYAFTNLPAGPFPVCDPRYRTSYTKIDGLSITPDASLCVIPYSSYVGSRGEHAFDDDPDHPESDRSKQYHSFIDFYESGNVNNLKGSDASANWCSDADFYENDNTSANHGFSMLGINLNKAMMRLDVAPDPTTLPALANISGLKVFQYSKTVDGRIFGNETADDIPDNYKMSEMTGGLAINCGKYLHIEPSGYHGDSAKFYDGGKLTIDTGFGFEDEDGKMSVAIDAGRGLERYFVDENDERIGIKTHYSGLGFISELGPYHGGLTLLNKYVHHSTGIELKQVYLTPDELEEFIEGGNDHQDTMGRYSYSHIFGINIDDGLIITEENKIQVKTQTYKIVYNDDGTPKKNADGSLVRETVGHGLQFYGEEGDFPSFEMSGFPDPDFSPTRANTYDKRGLGIQVNDPDTNANHGLHINEKGTLCLNDGVSPAEYGYKKWKIEGTEVTRINGVEADRTQKSYEYNPVKDALTIKLGKGLIFADDRDSAIDPDDPSGCPCGCDCINYDNGSGGASTVYTVYDYIQSNGKQKIDTIAIKYNLNTTHIIEVSYMPVVADMEENTVIFEIGKHGYSGSQMIGYKKVSGGTPTTQSVVRIVNGSTNVDIEQNTTDGAYMADKVNNVRATFKSNELGVTWGTDPNLTTPTDSTAVDPAATLADMLMSLCGPSAVDVANNNSSIKLYGLKIYEGDTDTCIAELVPCKASSGYFGMFDKVNKRFYRNSSTNFEDDFTGGTPTGETFNGRGEHVTPPDPATLITYDELTYIMSTGGQKIITDISYNSGSSSHFITPSIKTTNTADQIFFEIGEHGEVGTCYGGFSNSAGAKTFVIKINNNVSDNEAVITQSSGDAAVANAKIFDGYVRYQPDTMFVQWAEDPAETGINNPTSIVNNFIVSGGNIKKTPITLFGASGSDTGMNASIYMYGLKIAETDVNNLIADYVPVISSENEVGLFDKVNKKFVTKSSGSSAFTAGDRTGTRFDYQGNIIS